MQQVVKLLIAEELSHLRTHKIPVLVCAFLNRGNLSTRYVDAGLAWSMTFTKFFVRPRFMFRDGSEMLCVATNAGCCTLFPPTSEDFLPGQSFFTKCSVFARLSCSHRIQPILCISHLQTHQHGHHFQVTTAVLEELRQSSTCVRL